MYTGGRTKAKEDEVFRKAQEEEEKRKDLQGVGRMISKKVSKAIRKKRRENTADGWKEEEQVRYIIGKR